MARLRGGRPAGGPWTVSFSIAVCLLALPDGAPGAFSPCRHSKVGSLLVANCQGQRQRSVPSTDPSVQVLLLNFNDLSSIRNSSFPRLTALRMLSLGKQLRGAFSVGESAFQNVSGITFLDLGGNRNLTLHPAALRGLASLEVLLLDTNGLGEAVLEKGFFRDLVSLKRLDLSGNRLRRLRPDPTFQGLRQLSVLQLKLNQIGEVCGDDLQHLRGRHLALLDLSSNRLLSRPGCANPFRDITLGTLDISSTSWSVEKAEQFFSGIAGTQIAGLRMQHSGAIGSGFGFHNLKGLSAGTFSQLRGSGILSLDMSNGFLNRLVPSTFSGLPDLHALLLGSNQISEIQDGAFAGLRKLRVLDLSHNLLGELYGDTLRPLRASPLQHLILRSNHIGVAQHNALEGLGALTVLDLWDNALRHVPRGRLPSLRRLELGQNRLEDAWGISRLGGNLTHLGLSANRLRDLGQVWGHLGGIPGLLFLDLSGNRLARCAGVPKGPRELRELDLSHNRLGDVWSGAACLDLFRPLEKLQVLNLSANGLRQLPGGLLQGLGALRVLNLSANLLPGLPEGAFGGLAALRALSLRGNPLLTLSPAALGPPGRLRSLDLRELSLLCRCGLAELQGWMQARRAAVAAPEPVLFCTQGGPDLAQRALPEFLGSSCAPQPPGHAPQGRCSQLLGGA